MVNYSYDLQGRLEVAETTTSDSGSATRFERVTYDYDANGIRISALHEVDETADGSYESRIETKYLVDHRNFTGYQQVVRETHYDADSGDVVKVIDYTFGTDEISQTIVTYTDGTETSRETHYFLHDGHGSVRVLVDATAAIVRVAGIEQIYLFDAYGDALNQAAKSAATTLLYSGEQFDSRIGQQYLRARYYSAQSGRFNRLDPFFGSTVELACPEKLVRGYEGTGWLI